MRNLIVAVAATALFASLGATIGFAQATGGGGGPAGSPVGGPGAAGGVGGSGIGAGIGGSGGGGPAGLGGGALGGSEISGGSLMTPGFGAHQGNILTGPGASGTPQNYFRGAMPGMGLSPQEAPSGALGPATVPGRYEAGGRGMGLGRTPPALGGTLGRGVGPVPKGGDANPAETLLDEMNGSHEGHRTGHAALRPPPKYRRAKQGLSSDPPSLAPQRIEEQAVYFARRGAYEDTVYHPSRGSYQKQDRPAIARRAPVARRPVY